MRKRRRLSMRPMRMSLRTFRAANVLSTARTFYAGNWTFGTASVNDFWRYGTYTLSSLPSYNEYVNLFDEYKINAVKVTFRPRYDSISPSDIVGTANQPQAYAHYQIDPASTTVPAGIYNNTTLNTFLEASGVKTVTLNRPFSIYFKPKVNTSVFGGSSGAEVVKGGWIKTTESAVSYRGYHMFLQQNNFGAVGTSIQLDMFVTYYMTFKNMK